MCDDNVDKDYRVSEVKKKTYEEGSRRQTTGFRKSDNLWNQRLRSFQILPHEV